MNSVPHKIRGNSRVGWIAGSLAASAVVALGIVLTLHYSKGTVEIELAEGVDAKSVAIAVKQGGEEIEVADAEHGWKLRIAGGVYEVELKGSNDKFKLENQSVTVERGKNAIVKVTLKDAALATDSGSPPVVPTLPATNLDKPFILVRDGKDLRAFKALPGAIADLQLGDYIEVRSNSRLPIVSMEPVTKPLMIRAGAGYRPLLAFISSGKPGDYISLQADFSAVDCDLDLRFSNFYGDSKSSWTLQGCRVWGSPPIAMRKWAAKDCVLVLHYGYCPNEAPATECVLENCLIHNLGYVFTADSGSHTLKLQNCTFYAVDSQYPYLIRGLGEQAKLAVEATRNIFHCSSQALLIEGKSLPRITWQGRDNCYSGMFYGVWELKPDKSVILKEKGLPAWNKLWKEPEVDSREVEWLAFEWGRLQNLEGPERLREIRAALEKLAAANNLTQAGPNWDLVGPGDSYVRTLAAEGRGVAEAELRPERLEGGPFVLIRRKQDVRGYLTLKEAVDAAQDKDVVEIRTDGPVAPTVWSGDSRLLTIRAAPGYAPVIDGLTSSGTDRLILEGLTLRDIQASGGNYRWEGDKLLFPQRGSILRLMNCAIKNSAGWLLPHGEMAPEIVNCDCAFFGLGLPPTGVARFRNSVLGTGLVESESKQAQPGKLEINRCVFWGPELMRHQHETSLMTSSPVTFTSRHSIFVSPATLTICDGPSLSWQGSANVFVKPTGFQRGGGPLSLAQFQTEFKTDLDSLELPPWDFDPAQWRILRDKSAGYQPRSDGADYGADIDRLIKVLSPSDTR